MNEKKTLVLGASDNPSRYSYLAIQRLRSHHHPVVAVGRKITQVADVIIEKEKKQFTDIDTITLTLILNISRNTTIIFYLFIPNGLFSTREPKTMNWRDLHRKKGFKHWRPAHW